MALVLVQSKSADSGGNTVNQLDCNFDSNCVVGNLVVTVFGSDDTTADAGLVVYASGIYTGIPQSPLIIQSGGDGSTDCHLAVAAEEVLVGTTLVRVAQGSTDEMWMHCMEFSGHDRDTPVTAASVAAALEPKSTSHFYQGTETTPAGDLGYIALAFDGADTTFSLDSSMQSQVDIFSGTTGNDASGTVQWSGGFNPSSTTITTSASDGSVMIGFIVHAKAPKINQTDFRFYADGTETASVALAALNTDAEVLADTNFQFRAVLEDANEIGTIRAWQVNFSHNSGVYQSMTIGTALRWVNSPNLIANDLVSTQRVGSGTFNGGNIYEGSSQVDYPIPAGAGEELESLWSFIIDSAQVGVGDTFDLKIYHGDTPFEELRGSYNVARITVIDAAPVVEQDSFRLYAEGTESGSTPLAAINTNANVGKGLTFQARFLLKETGGGTKLTGLQGQWRYNNGGGWNGWQELSLSFSIGGYKNSPLLTDGEATTQRIGSGTFIDGRVYEWLDLADNDAITPNAESEYVLSLATWPSAEIGFLIEYRLVDDTGTVLDAYTNTPQVTVVANNIVVNATSDALTITPVDQDVKVDIDVEINATSDALTITPVDQSVQIDLDTIVNATSDSLAISSVDQGVTAAVDVDATSQALTITPVDQDVHIEANIDVDATSDALAITAVDQSVTAAVDVDVTSQALTITPVDQLVLIDIDTIVDADSDSLTITPVNQGVKVDVNVEINAGSDALVITPVDQAVEIQEDLLVNAGSDSLAITAVDQDVKVDIDVEINATSDALTITPVDQNVEAGTEIQAGTDALSISPVDQSVTVAVEVNAASQALTITPINQSVEVGANVDVSAGSDALVITAVDQNVLIDIRIDATSDALTITPVDQDVQVGSDVEINAGSDALTITPVDQEVVLQLNLDVNATSDALTITPVDQDVEVAVEVDATSQALTITPVDQVVKIDIDVVVNADSDSLTITPVNQGITVQEDLVVNATSDALTITPVDQDVQIGADVTVEADSDALTITPVDQGVQIDLDTIVNATSDSLAISPVDQDVRVELDTIVAAGFQALAITPVDQEVIINVDLIVNAGVQALTITPVDQTVFVVNDSEFILCEIESLVTRAKIESLVTRTKIDLLVQGDSMSASICPK